MFESLRSKLRQSTEKAVLWTIRAFLYRFSAVIAAEFAKYEQLGAQVRYVAADHWNHLNDLDKRLQRLERTALSAIAALSKKGSIVRAGVISDEQIQDIHAQFSEGR